MLRVFPVLGLLMSLAASALGQDGYQLPPQAIVDIIDARRDAQPRQPLDALHGTGRDALDRRC
jgi:hypothetical protein